MLKTAPTSLGNNENGQAILMLTVVLTALLASALVPFLGSTSQAKAANTHVSTSQSMIGGTSLSKLLSDGTYCALALRNQHVHAPSTETANNGGTDISFLQMPGVGPNGIPTPLASTNAIEPGTALTVKKITITPTSWPGTAIAYNGNPNAVMVPVTLQIMYQLDMSHNYGQDTIAATPVNLKVVLDSTTDGQVIGCEDDLVAACAASNRAVNVATTSPLARQNCEVLQATQIDDGDAIAPNTMRCALSNKSDAYCWGGGVYGMADTSQPQNQPELISVFTHNVSQIASSAAHSCAIAGGSLYCWGSNGYLQAGPGPNPISNPTLIAGIPGTVQKVALSAGTTCAMTQVPGFGNKVYCWGYNNDGEAGTGNIFAANSPTDTGLTNVTDLQGRFENFCALKSDQTLWCWGSNGNGILEGVGSYNGGPPLSPTPVQITGLAGLPTAVTVGWTHACVILSGTGQVQCWGGNDSGELGIGSIGFPNTHFLPGATVTGLTNILQVSAGNGDTCAVDPSGSATCWGSNQYGMTGAASTQTTPQSVPGLTTGVSKISAGSERTCALMACGQVRCLGNNQNGELGDGTTNNSSIAVPTQNFGAGSIACPP